MIRIFELFCQPGFGNPMRREHGFTLVELMVAMTVGLLVLTGVTVIFLGANTSTSELQKSGKQIDTASFALDEISSGIRSAAYWGEFSIGTRLMSLQGYCPDYCQNDDPNLPAGAPPELKNVVRCKELMDATKTDLDFCKNINNDLWTYYVGYKYDVKRSLFYFACPNIADLKNKGLTTNFIKECKPDVSDVGPLPSDKIINSVAIQNGNPGQKGKTYNQDTQGLVVRRAEDISIAPANAKSIFVSRCDVETVDSIVNNLNMRFNKFDGCKGVERKFLESVFYVNESNQLVRKDSGNDGFEVIAENVEHMRVEINYPTVSIYLLVRNSEESLGSLKTPTFVMGSVELGGLDSKYRYRVFSTTVEMTNESGRL